MTFSSLPEIAKLLRSRCRKYPWRREVRQSGRCPDTDRIVRASLPVNPNMLDFIPKIFMKTAPIKTCLGFALTMGLALAIPVANAQIVSSIESPAQVSIIGLGMGAAPDYMGSASAKRGAVP